MGKPADSEEVDAGYYIKGEFPNNGYVKNDMLHKKGVLSMARTVDTSGKNPKDYYDTASSQFFIVHESNTSTRSLDYEYASFGYVLAGMDVVDAIAASRVDMLDKPFEDVVIEKVEVTEF